MTIHVRGKSRFSGEVRVNLVAKADKPNRFEVNCPATYDGVARDR